MEINGAVAAEKKTRVEEDAGDGKYAEQIVNKVPIKFNWTIRKLRMVTIKWPKVAAWE